MRTVQSAVEDLRERHRLFWDMAPVAQPLLSVGRYGALKERDPFPLADGRWVGEGDLLRPQDIAAGPLASGRPGTLVSGDFIQGVAPYDLCWTEAIAGCPLRWRTGHVWAECFLGEPAGLQLASDDPWLARLLEITRLQVEQAQGQYPVCQPLLRGPVDMAAAALGDEALCLALIDQPDRARRLLASCTEIFIAVARTWSAAVPSFAEGYCLYGIWAPGRSLRTQCDNAALLSPELYRDFLVCCDERICASFDYPLMHTHSGFIGMVAQVLLQVQGLRAVQVSLDWPAGPGVAELLPVFQLLNQHLPLIITGGLSQAELGLLLKNLSPRGLCLQVDIHD
ncbi:MAG: hypothetical protein HYW07_22320 [Candidatus Latescibacteria bacterium]|nr:hypothetical protein [Candidatus Latescibacterota bacterium]